VNLSKGFTDELDVELVIESFALSFWFKINPIANKLLINKKIGKELFNSIIF
jgi:hypothetical protein